MNKHSSKHKQTTNILNMSKTLSQTWTNIVPNINKQHPIHEQTTLSQTWINNNPYINKQPPNINKQHPKHEQTTLSQTQINIPHPNKHYDPKHEQPPSQKHEQRTPPSHEQTKDPRTTWPKNETNPQIDITTYLKKCRQTGHASCRSRCIAKDFCLALNVNNVDYTCHALYFEMRCKLGFLFLFFLFALFCVYLFIYLSTF